MFPHIHPPHYKVQPTDRAQLLQQQPALIWFTGLSGSGKSTLANGTDTNLYNLGYKTFVLDGDIVRGGLCRDLSFSEADRKENMRRIGEVSKIMMQAGIIVIAAFIAPFRAERQMIKELVGMDSFFEIHVACPIEICEQRDTKGLYRKARNNEICDFTGIHSPYEAPEAPFLAVDTEHLDTKQALTLVLHKLLPKLAVA